MLIFDSTKQHVLNPDLKFIDSANYLDTFLNIHIESFPIVTKYIEYKMKFKLSVYIEKYKLWEYKTYKIDNIPYICIPIENILKINSYLKEKITYYCMKCFIRTNVTFSSFTRNKSNKYFSSKSIYCKQCSIEHALEEKYGPGIINAFQAKEVKQKIKEISIQRYGTSTATHTKEANEKRKQTCLKKYGKEVAAAATSVREKISHTLTEKYGTDITSVGHLGKFESIQRKKEETSLKHYKTKHPRQSQIIKDKAATTNIERYGDSYPLNNPRIQEKVRKTCIERFGFPYATSSPEIKEKIKQTNIERYGYEYIAQVPQFKQKQQQTMIERYGKPFLLQIDEFKEKIKNTMLEKYGYAFPQQVPEIRERTMQTMFKNKTAPTSINQNHIFDLLTNNNEIVALNYPFKRFFLDIAFIKNLIDLEYNGKGHDLSMRLGNLTEKEFQQKEIKREILIRQSGWKIINIISSNDKLPNDDTLLKMIHLAKEYLLNTNHTWINIDLDNQWFIFTRDRITVSFDSLKTIL